MNPFKKVTDESLLEDKRILKQKLSEQVKANKEAEARYDKLKKSYENVDTKFRQVSAENGKIERRHEDQITKLTIDHTKTVDDMKNKFENDIATQRWNHNETVQGLMTEHGAKLRGLRENHDRDISELNNRLNKLWDDRNRDISKLEKDRDREMATLKDDHGSEVTNLKNDHTREVDKLLGQLLANQDDDHAWPDDVLKLKFRELQRTIESVTSPRTLNIPPSQLLDEYLDPTNFVSRAPRGKAHFVIKSKIWAIILEQFFVVPFGFGALGFGKGQKELIDVLLTWRKLLDDRFESELTSGNQYAVFEQDPLANKWRSATFQSVHMALAGDEYNSRSDSHLVKISAENVRQTVGRILSVLNEVAKFSNNSLQNETEREVGLMVNLARDIALQFGINPAQLRVVVPRYGDRVQIGEEYHDCEDGDCSSDSFFTVDLLVVPGLQKIGDGRSEMISKRVIVPCEIYPTQ